MMLELNYLIMFKYFSHGPLIQRMKVVGARLRFPLINCKISGLGPQLFSRASSSTIERNDTLVKFGVKFELLDDISTRS